MSTTQGFFMVFWTKHLENSSYTATFLTSKKPSQQSERNCRWSKDEFKVIVSHKHTSVDRPEENHIYLIYADTECRQDDLLSMLVDEDGWLERERKRENHEKSVLSAHLNDQKWWSFLIVSKQIHLPNLTRNNLL